MEIKVVPQDMLALQTHTLVVNLFEGVTQPGGATGAVDKALGGAVSQLIAEGEVTGKRGQMALIHTFGKIKPARVLVLGLGRREKFTLDTVRDLSGEACRYLRRLGAKSAATIVHGAGIGGLEPEAAARAIAEGAVMGLYTFTRHKSRPEEPADGLRELLLVEREADKLPALEHGVRQGRVLAESVNLTRDLINEPANILTPTALAEAAARVAADHGLECAVYDREWMEKMSMGALLGVARGSRQPPKFVVLRYWGDPANRAKALGLVGKGITFDTGGISLKPAEGMANMKGDMSGAAAVIAAMRAIAQLAPRVNVTALVPTTENMPGGDAQRPGDVVRALNGKTIEVDNTDAEGRLILADALSYGRKLGLSPMLDVATLTGAIRMTFGSVCTGGFTNDQSLLDRLVRAGATEGERIWQLPMYEEYREQNKSDVADVKNSGGRFAGSITAAMFLSEFAEDTPWVHLDIAGSRYAEKDSGAYVKGTTGVMTRTLTRFAMESASGT